MDKTVAKYQRYDEYKDSGVEAIGYIPNEWKAIRGKFIFNEINERSEFGEETLLSVSEYYGVKPRGEKINEGEFLTRAESLEGYKKCYKNDLVMNIMLAWKRGLGISKYDGIVSPAYSVFRFNKLASPDYMNYLLRTEEYTKYFKTRSTGIIDSRLRLYPESFSDIFVLLPSLKDQTNIANFLDHETAIIDSLIEKQQKLIELLQEKRQAVISHAVTKGLNPDVTMRDSGVEWLGQVPEHWDVQPTKRFFRLVTEFAPENNNFELLSVYTEIGVKPRKELEQKGNKASTTDGYWMVKKGDIIVNKLLAWMGAVGYSEYEGVTSPAYDILRPTKNLNAKFFHYLFRTKIANIEFKRWSRGIMEMRLRLYFDELGRILMPFPKLEEQNIIVNFLDYEILKIDRLIAKAESAIQLMQERRTALISAAVTGKIDVRNWQAPDEAVTAHTA